MSAPELQHLLRVLSDRDIDLGHDDVAWAFQSSQTKDAIQHWAQKYLAPSNLLTKEELAFSEARQPNANSKGTNSRYITDEEFEGAISQLEASTAAIDKQCRLLEKQRDALVAIRARNVSGNDAGGANASRQGKVGRERAQIEADSNELSRTIRSNLQASSKLTGSATSALPTNIDKVLEKDDRLLDGLNKILPQISTPANSDTEADQVQALCDALTTLTAAEIRARLDVVYSNAAQAIDIQPDELPPPDEAEKTSEALQVELGELCREIDGLATMAVESQYRIPISQALESATTEAEAERLAWTEYTSAALEYMAARLDVLADHSDALHAHGNAIKSVTTTLDRVLAMTVETKATVNGTASAAPEANRKGLRTLRLVQANISEAQDPATQLLRYLDIKSEDPSDPARFANDLAITTRARREKLAAHTANTEKTITTLLADTVARSQGDQDVLNKAVHVHSEFGPLRTSDAKAEEAIHGLEEKTDLLSDEMRRLDIDEMMKVVRTRQQTFLQQQ